MIVGAVLAVLHLKDFAKKVLLASDESFEKPENVREFCKTYKFDSHCCAVELYSFPTVFKLFDFDIVANKTDHVDYGNDSDEFSDNTKDTDRKYGVHMQDKNQTFVNCLPVLTGSRYKLIDAWQFR